MFPKAARGRERQEKKKREEERKAQPHISRPAQGHHRIWIAHVDVARLFVFEFRFQEVELLGVPLYCRYTVTVREFVTATVSS